MSRRSLISRADAIDRDQRRRTMGATMWSESPVAPTAEAAWAGDGGGGGWDPGWLATPEVVQSLVEVGILPVGPVPIWAAAAGVEVGILPPVPIHAARAGVEVGAYWPDAGAVPKASVEVLLPWNEMGTAATTVEAAVLWDQLRGEFNQVGVEVGTFGPGTGSTAGANVEVGMSGTGSANTARGQVEVAVTWQ